MLKVNNSNTKESALQIEINRLASRNIAKLFSYLEGEGTILTKFERDAIKAQFRYFQDDIINHVGALNNENQNN
jgi:hypothetical protein